jgi:HK97 family phage major capsid protein/HK97 family phage prohead protease
MDRLELKASLSVDEAGAVTGFASIFGTADLHGDIVHKGAFAGATPPIPMLASHDQADVVGVWDELVETAQGLAVKGRLLVADVVRAAEVRALIIAGAMGGLSIGYLPTSKKARVGGGRDLFRVNLKEISIVAVPMHPGAKITAVKALEGGKVDEVTLEELQAKLGEVETKHAGDMSAAIAAAVAPLLEKMVKLEAKANRPGGDGGAAQEPTIERKAFAAYITRGNLAPETELKALSVSSDPNGGYLAPPEFSSEVIKDIVEISPFRSLASVKGASAPSVIYPTRKPGGNATWDDDTTAEPETATTNIFGQLEILTKAMSTFVDIPNSLLQDAAMVEAEIREMCGEDFEKKETFSFTNGAGFYDPEGILTNADIANFNYGAIAFTALDAVAPLITMLYSIAPSYRNKGVWMMNGTTLGKMRNWTDANGLKVWQPSVQIGQPETLLGRPVVENVDMPDVASGATPIIYGDFSGYRILDRLGLSVLVDPYSQATAKKTRYHMGRRVGGRVLQPIKFKKLRMSI